MYAYTTAITVLPGQNYFYRQQCRDINGSVACLYEVYTNWWFIPATETIYNTMLQPGRAKVVFIAIFSATKRLISFNLKLKLGPAGTVSAEISNPAELTYILGVVYRRMMYYDGGYKEDYLRIGPGCKSSLFRRNKISYISIYMIYDKYIHLSNI